MRFLSGAFTASLVILALKVWGPSIIGRALDRGNNTDHGDRPKQPTYRYHGERLHHD